MAPATENTVQVLTETKSNYKVIAFALDLTGKKLIDEIFHITASEGNKALFDQYIMTYRDISRSSVRTHAIRIFTMLGKYRVLKDTITMKSIRTKSEYSTLNDFLQWLTERKGNSEGIILTYHDNGMDQVTPFLMEALERYQLTDAFFKVVKGFVNCCTIASNHPDIKGKSLALRSLARRLLGEGQGNRLDKATDSESDSAKGKEGTPETNGDSESQKEDKEKDKGSEGKTTETDTENAKETAGEKTGEEGTKKTTKDRRRRKAPSRDKAHKEREQFNQMQGSQYRAVTTYKVLLKMSPPLTEPTIFEDELLRHLSTRDEEIKTMEKQRELATKVRSLRPIFLGKIRTSPKDRSRAVLLRRYLIEAALDYATLKEAFETGSTGGIMRIVEETSAKKKKQHLEELVELICQHFKQDPKKDLNANDVKGGEDAGAGGDGGQSGAHDPEYESTDCDTGDESEGEFQEANGDN